MIWGQEPSNSAILIKDFFLEHKVLDILIPGVGYGRNAKVFCDNGIKVTGIEISKSAIKLAKKNISKDIQIHCGSITEMPFNEKKYEGIFCYSLIHLLNKYERRIFLQNCYNQLKPNSCMFFVVVSKKANMFGEGKELSKDRFKIQNGLKVFFYDEQSIKQEFSSFGLISYNEIDEPIKHMENEPPLQCFLIKCQRTVMKNLTDLPNIGKTLADKLNLIGIENEQDLKQIGSENAIIKIATIENSGACINMLYALEGAIQGIRWHGLDKDRKQELKEFYRMTNK